MISQAQILAAMKAVAMFSALSDSAVRQLVSTCRHTTLAGGDIIFSPLQAADRFFVVLAGKVKIYKTSPRGDEQILHLYGKGETFGEAAMWAKINYPAFAEALEKTEIISISRENLGKAVAANPDLAMGMLAGLSAKLRDFNRLIEELSLKEVPARLAGVLLKEARHAKSRTITLKQTKRQLAAQIGTIAETLSRALGKMKADGLIEVSGSTVEILDMDALADLAENQ
ncbi:MAG: Crp/Fnr family transcriptional regulator [Planctomycetaceae bacterium]|nr:MAG: Crp/Fnr family transcriptional regulator [Planctomycetaceae bacterium]